MTPTDIPALRDVFVPDELHALEAPEPSALLRVLLFAVMYAGAATVSVLLVQHVPHGVFLALPFQLLAAASLHGISLFTHDGVHGALLHHAGLNRLFSALCAWPVLQNFAAYRVLHMAHHRHMGREGDPDHYPNYARWTWMERALCWGRLVAGYPVYITAIPLMGLRAARGTERAWILAETLMAWGLCALAWWMLPAAWMVHGWLTPMVFINFMVNVRGMSQHTLLPHPEHPVLGSRTILGNAVTRFFMCNENFHLEHHLFPRVPWHRLPALHARLAPVLRAEGAPFIGAYRQFVGEFIRSSVLGHPVGTVTHRDATRA